jgi:hypothetical protein
MATKTVVLKKPVRPANHIAPVTAKKNVAKDPVVETYRALAPLRVEDSPGCGITHIRQYGDFVPEAAGFKNIWVYLNTKQLEMVYVNQSQIDAWRERFVERCAMEDAEKRAHDEALDEERQLRARLKEIEAAKAKKVATPPNSHAAPKEITKVEVIDLGAVPKQPGIPQVAPLPKVTREVPIQKNVSENRNRPNKVGRTSRKA